jgi:hypothetical protein
MDALHIQNTGVSLSTGVSSVSSVIPNTSSGTKPTQVRIMSTEFCFAKFGSAGVVATPNDILISPYCDEVYSVSGNTHIAVLQSSVSGLINIMPLENT